MFNVMETHSTLRFGWQMKQIKNKAVVNIVYSTEQLKDMLHAQQAENEQLKRVIVQLQQQLAFTRHNHSAMSGAASTTDDDSNSEEFTPSTSSSMNHSHSESNLSLSSTSADSSPQRINTHRPCTSQLQLASSKNSVIYHRDPIVSPLPSIQHLLSRTSTGASDIRALFPCFICPLSGRIMQVR